MFQAITPRRARHTLGGFLLGTSVGIVVSLAAIRGVTAQDPVPAADLASLGGQVVDARTSEPLVGATVIVAIAGGAVSEEAKAVSDLEGRFLLLELAPGEHIIRIHFGGREAEPRTIQLQEGLHTEVQVRIISEGEVGPGGVPVAELPPLDVHIEGEARPGKLRGFYQRRETTHGHFISGREIRARAPFRTSDLMRDVPGLIVTRDPGGRPAVRVGRHRGCSIEFYLDGSRAPGLSIDDVRPEDIDGLEIYRGASEVPIQYRRANTCAAILIWTRDPGAP